MYTRMYTYIYIYICICIIVSLIIPITHQQDSLTGQPASAAGPERPAARRPC